MRIVRNGTVLDKEVTYGYVGDGKLTSVLYPDAIAPCVYSYNALDQPVEMTGKGSSYEPWTGDVVKNVTYGVAGERKTMESFVGMDGATPLYSGEVREYNELVQLTKQTAMGTSLEYVYPAGDSTGRIVARKNGQKPGPAPENKEVVSYVYDSLHRLTSATSNAGWTQSYEYDGFGNMWSQTMTGGGAATPFSVTFDMNKNRIAAGNGWTYDDNGNTTAMPVPGGTAALFYDIDNRLTMWSGPGGTEQYRYLADNKRAWKKEPSGVETVYFYGAYGEKLVTYTMTAAPVALLFQSENVYFAGKLIRANGKQVTTDRLGSVVWRDGTKHDYLPYGEEMAPVTQGNVDKFGTYHRDATTGLDYADQRYFGALSGRFLTADPYEASGGASNPGSWGRYSSLVSG
jgi:RHS repeat-associated protein